MEVLKQTSPTADPAAPMPWPSRIVPSASTTRPVTTPPPRLITRAAGAIRVSLIGGGASGQWQERAARAVLTLSCRPRQAMAQQEFRANFQGFVAGSLLLTRTA